MAPPATASDDSHQQLLDRLDIAHLPRPFRNPNWKPSQRRNKNVKQLLAETSRKEASVMATQNNSGAATPGAAGTGATTDGTQPPSGGAIAQAAENLSNLVREKNARSMYPSGPAVTYTNIESAPSLHPSHQKHYCDITGLPAPYTDPKTRLRYHDKEIFGRDFCPAEYRNNALKEPIWKYGTGYSIFADCALCRVIKVKSFPPTVPLSRQAQESTPA
ncbi:hypothetical protein DTO166G4_4718 [Paecilomyces variotii]|nr:hypothetical protein DTO166G4_4718 [Paecilomyces variotii]KAJ9239352.1 hypothetical protein DTO166G5_2521 [Paecilomyces variotii]KAJ9247171.1 hypothetical protein DTO207G8_8319 [Paecilomyces variotii]KAJ9259825.1 hypothetical protein DTO195F2_4702 [Paecilomyces variotii]KAJ9305075.1 hypothetical protein DTO217A2_5410 [Paecilomyces variotii]